MNSRRAGEDTGSGVRDSDTVPFEAVSDAAIADTTVFEALPDETTVFEVASDLDAPGAAAAYDDEEFEEPPMRTRRLGPLLVLGVFAAIVFGGGYLLYRSFFGAPDYEGTGQGDVIIQVDDGDTISAIGTTLTKVDVVRSQKAFTRAAADDDERARSVQPGYYRLRLRMSGPAAVKLLLDPRSRVGQLEIKGGAQLDDTRGPDGTVAPGVLTQAAQATCTQLSGTSTCVGVGQLREAMAKAPPEALGVPDWARADVAKAEPSRRLEGLVAPGRYDVRPGSTAEEVLRVLVSRSAAQYEATGLVTGAGQVRYNPYQVLVIASLIEKEGITGDFEKISEVIYNRLTSRVRLELDSTVNYPLDLQSVQTTAADRGRAGPYNSYANYGLPPTPIGAPGTKAIEAALRPATGPWMFFVKCRTDGTSCFAMTLAEHQQNVKAAQAAGVY
ncbi:MAG: endolytic transglycosylase MltG [Actinomycetota bacterium]|nr:endolytic transglycosylase MltG [Actinomycetota bacterium]